MGAVGRVIDADGHVLEAMSAWDRLPADQRLRVERDAIGLDHVYIGAQEIVTCLSPVITVSRSHALPGRSRP